MAREEIEGTGRVSVFRLTHMWNPRRVGIVAYTSTGNFGDTAVVGYIPFPHIPDLSLLDIAARHEPQRLYGAGNGSQFAQACWLICTGTGSRLVREKETLDLQEVPWVLETDSSIELEKTMYGHTGLKTGRFRFKDAELMDRARSLLLPGDVPEMNETDLPPHGS